MSTRLLMLSLFFFLSFGTGVVHAQIHAGLSVSSRSGCPPLVTHFSDLSSGRPVRWHWVFDDLSPADTSNLANPNWIYTTPGDYNVKLVVTDATGARDSVTMTSEIHIAPRPVVRFTASDTILSCPPQTISFTNQSDTGACSPYWTWLIDSAFYHTHDASYTFVTPGYYTISLQETDSCGCTGSLVKTAYVKIDSFPVICYNTRDSVPCFYPATVCFNNCTSGGATYLWHFGDGATDTSLAPCHIYTTWGNFTDTLTASSVAGCASSVIKPSDIRIGSTIVNILTFPTHPCVGTPVICYDTIVSTTHHYWRFSAYRRYQESYADSPTFSVDTLETYTLSDSLWNDYGCTVLSSRTVNVDSTPNITIVADNFYRCSPNDTATFTVLTTDTSGLVSYMWEFGDPGTGLLDTSTAADPTHIYSATGFFTPTVQITDGAGCIATESAAGYVTIYPTYDTMTLSIDSGCAPLFVLY